MNVPCCRTCQNFVDHPTGKTDGLCCHFEFSFRPHITPAECADIFACGHHQDWKEFREIAAEVDFEEGSDQENLVIQVGLGDETALLRSTHTNKKLIDSLDRVVGDHVLKIDMLGKRIAALETKGGTK